MKILLYTDNHYSKKTSVINWQGSKYSARIENQILSLNWVEQLAVDNDCDSVICLGDFFDKPVLDDEEISGLKEIRWSNITHFFLVGNHESTVMDLRYSATNILSNNINRFIIDQPFYIQRNDFYLVFIPYYLPDELKPIEEYLNLVGLKDVDKNKVIILSHNDICGIDFIAGIKSTSGFTLGDIENNCNLFLNGHIHSREKFCKNGYNIGNLTGKNFTEDSFKHPHGATILNIENGKATLEFVENPYAFNFYTLNIIEDKDFNQLDEIKNNSIVRIHCSLNLRERLMEQINNDKRIIKSTIFDLSGEKVKTNLEEDLDLTEITAESYMVKFRNFCLNHSEKVDDLFMNELEEILK